MHDRSLRGLDVDAERTGDGMGHREEINGDPAKVDMRTALDLAELRRLDAELRKLTLDEAECELAGEDGHLVVEVLQQVR